MDPMAKGGMQRYIQYVGDLARHDGTGALWLLSQLHDVHKFFQYRE